MSLHFLLMSVLILLFLNQCKCRLILVLVFLLRAEELLNLKYRLQQRILAGLRNISSRVFSRRRLISSLEESLKISNCSCCLQSLIQLKHSLILFCKGLIVLSEERKFRFKSDGSKENNFLVDSADSFCA